MQPLFFLSLPLSFVLATPYSIWKTKIVSLLAQPLAEIKKEEKREKERDTERDRGMRVKKTPKYFSQSSKTKTGAPQPTTHSVLLLLLFSTSSYSKGSHPPPVQILLLDQCSTRPEHYLTQLCLLHQVIHAEPLIGKFCLTLCAQK